MIVVIKGIGHNLCSLSFALKRLGVEAIFTDDKELIRNATHVILPGVGAANQAMANLRANDLVDTIKQLKVPVLGICLGMQLLMSSSEEAETDTLDIIPGRVKRFQSDWGVTIPHMGWNQITKLEERDPLMKNIPNESFIYFVHSFAVFETPFSLARTNHGRQFSAVIRKDNFYGVQFHPERSGDVGVQFLKNFLAL